MDQDRFKQQLIRDKEWLRELYQSNSQPNTKRVLNNASDTKLDTLCKFIHLLSNGAIKISKDNFDNLAKRHMRIIRKDFESKSAIKRLLKSERMVKLKKLNKFVPIFSFLLFTLFNRQ